MTYSNSPSINLKKPALSYAALISEAIIESEDGRLTLREIYTRISNKYPFYSISKTGWQNSIRHNLSLNRAFYKLPKTRNINSKGCFWCISKHDAEIILNKSRRHKMQMAPNRYSTYRNGPTTFSKIEVNELQEKVFRDEEYDFFVDQSTNHFFKFE